jgi:hypothetical protein
MVINPIVIFGQFALAGVTYEPVYLKFPALAPANSLPDHEILYFFLKPSPLQISPTPIQTNTTHYSKNDASSQT